MSLHSTEIGGQNIISPSIFQNILSLFCMAVKCNLLF